MSGETVARFMEVADRLRSMWDAEQASDTGQSLTRVFRDRDELEAFISLAIEGIDANDAHAEVGRHAGFLLKLWTANEKHGSGHAIEILKTVIVQHHGFPTVDGSKL